MVAIELVKIEVRRHWLQLLISVLVLSLFTPITIWSDYMNVKSYENVEELGRFVVDFQHMNNIFIFVVFMITLGIIQIGSERSNGTLELTCSMPYSRAQIYLTKFFIGFSVILISWMFSFFLTGLIIQVNEIQTNYFTGYFLYELGTLMLFYTITVSAGAFTGTPFAQGLVTMTVSILPFLLILLSVVQLEIVFNFELPPNSEHLSTLYNISPISYLYLNDQYFSLNEIYVSFILSGVFFTVGYFAFMKHPMERNGAFFTWKEMDRPVQVIVILLGIIGFSAFGYLTDDGMLGYFIGGGIGALIGFIVSYYLIFKKKK